MGTGARRRRALGLVGLAALAAAAGAAETAFDYVLAGPGLTSAGIYGPAGRLVRTLWTTVEKPAGSQTGTWDGLDDFGRAAPAGDYTFRVVLNGSTYRNVGTLGNTGQPPGEPQHIQHGVISVCTDDKGNIYTANGWEEAGHDFKVFDPAGKTLFHARYQIRNGNPNGAPHAIAVDDKFIYCATHGWNREPFNSKMQIQRFHIANGDLEPFTDPALEPLAGHIELYEWPQRQVPDGTPERDAALMRLPVRALGILGDAIVATDALGGKIHTFHKVTGARLGEFPVTLPHGLAIHADGRLFVAHEHGKVSVFTLEGEALGTVLADAGEIRSLAFGPGGLLYLADGAAGQVRVYETGGGGMRLQRTFGRKAQPGDYAPDRFYELQGAAADPQGGLVTIAGVTGGGARIASFGPDGACRWEHMALVFCDVGSYAAGRPDELITQRFHRLALGDKDRGEWQYRGTLLDGDPKYLWGNHGVLRLIELGGSQFVYQCYGDGMQIYRRHGDLFRLAAMAGGNEPTPDGRFVHNLPPEEREGDGWWSWTDPNADGRIEDGEVVWFKAPGQARYALFGMNADRAGNLVYAEHHTRAVWELPMAGLDGNGNPVYDWRLAREIVAADDSPAGFFPLMAVRADDGSLYAMGRSDAWERPGGKEAGYIWMGGWALARYDRANRRQWITRLPEVCPGMCDIPGGNGGVMLGYYKLGHIYHYEPGGLLIGVARLGDPAGNQTGWMDNTAALSVQRDPRDGVLDVFGEDSWLNRMIWYRVNDRDVQVVTGPLRRN
jgi:sugar lactone lactonase YvrE